MTTCSVTNSPAIYCDHGCCGTADNRICCEFTLSESVVIVICIVGALVVVAIVVALIVCLTSKQKNRVTRIQPRPRRMLDDEPRARRIEIPKPPPYSEAPPQYDTITMPEESRSTEPILPGYNNSRTPRGQRTNRSQNRSTNRRNTRTQPDEPPPYISVIRTEQNNDLDERNYSPEPGTSGLGRVSDNEIIYVMDRPRHGSPHPSLASGRISTSMFNRTATLHKTASERSHRMVGLRNNNSVTPVTIREITVHSHVIHDTQNERNDGRVGRENKRNTASTSQIPRPARLRKNGSESKKVGLTNVTNNNTTLLPGALEEGSNNPQLGESPPPRNPAAAARSAQRHAVIHKLQQRRHLASPTPVQ